MNSHKTDVYGRSSRLSPSERGQSTKPPSTTLNKTLRRFCGRFSLIAPFQLFFYWISVALVYKCDQSSNYVYFHANRTVILMSLYETMLSHNISVVAANKIAASSSYENYRNLKETALRCGVKFLFETNVGAGLPIIGTINDLRNSGDRILRIEAVLSGTLNYIFNKISSDIPFSKAVMMAKEEGYSEPDPRIDLSGTDVIRKLVILTREAGYRIEQQEVKKELFVPNEYFKGTTEDFWKRLPNLDEKFEKKRQLLESEEKRWRFVATMDNGRACVSLKAVGKEHPFYNLEGSNNIVLLTTERYKEYPMLIQGYGAGASVTAAGVFSNIMSIANI